MSKAKNLGAGASFAQARPISARRAAIGAATDAPTAGVPEPTELPLNLISQNPDNPREELRNLEGLADSIREVGLVNAITIASLDAYLAERPDRAADIDDGTRFVVIDGHRRLAASRIAGVSTIRVSVDNELVSTDESLLEAAFVANVHRDDMNPLEQAHALQKLVSFYGSQNKAAKRLGIGQSTISSKLSILELDLALQVDLVAGRRTVEDVRNLSKLSAEQQREKADARAVARHKKSAGSTGQARQTRPEEDRVAEQRDPEERSRRDNSSDARSFEPSVEELPAPRAESSTRQSEPSELAPGESGFVAPLTRVTKMPWHDGNEVADLVLRKMEAEQQKILLARLSTAHTQVSD
ncbi:ParB/RepB/Spo0J family partition protein [Streptomyces sp. NPDC047981]|uniref:ParB/RepB/Spo0J family partition protein n=1 Tax=Streptomyces sp. NPDC047981 TaxID=3154610 RepID=UPI003422475B